MTEREEKILLIGFEAGKRAIELHPDNDDYDHVRLKEARKQVNSVDLANVGKQRELLLGLLRFERKNGYESTTLVNDEIVDQYLDEL